MAVFTTKPRVNPFGKNVFYDILEHKNAFLSYKNKKFKKSKNLHFFKGVNPWFWSQNGHFSNCFFYAIQGRKMSIMIFQNVKTPFQAIKTRSSQRRNIDIIPKGLTHAIGPKMAIFPTSFLVNIGQENLWFMIFQNEKTPFQAIETRSSKSRNIDIFPKGLTHAFRPKMAIFPTFFFR